MNVSKQAVFSFFNALYFFCFFFLFLFLFVCCEMSAEQGNGRVCYNLLKRQ